MIAKVLRAVCRLFCGVLLDPLNPNYYGTLFKLLLTRTYVKLAFQWNICPTCGWRAKAFQLGADLGDIRCIRV